MVEGRRAKVREGRRRGRGRGWEWVAIKRGGALRGCVPEKREVGGEKVSRKGGYGGR